jgi:hypothetical protein
VRNAEGSSEFTAQSNQEIVLENSQSCIFPKIEIVSMKGIRTCGLLSDRHHLMVKTQGTLINEAYKESVKSKRSMS